MIEIAVMCLALNFLTDIRIGIEDENEILSTMRQSFILKEIQQECTSKRWSSSLLPTLFSYIQSSMEKNNIFKLGRTDTSAAEARHYSRGSRCDIRITRKEVCDLPFSRPEGEKLAFGSRPFDWEEPRSVVRDLQPGPGILQGQHSESDKSDSLSEEAFCISLNVYFEARDQDIAGQVAVAQVVMNRVLDDRYSNDVCEVVYEHKQFSWYWDGKSDLPDNKEAWELAQLVANAVIAGSGHADLEGVTHYHSVHVKPFWINDPDKMEYVAQIGDHKFYFENM